MNKDIIKKIEEYIYLKTSRISPIHGFGHLKQTAIGAKWFAKCFGSSEEEQWIAYLAGLIHDLKRPSTEKIDHTEISINEAKSVLLKFNVEKNVSEEIINLIAEHRNISNIPLSKQWVFLADKLLEQSGAYLVFRRAYYIGECEDFKNEDFFEASVKYWEFRMNKFSPDKFHEKVQKLAKQQFIWCTDYIVALKKKKVWALQLTKDFFELGRSKKPDLIKLIQNYNSIYPEVEKLKKETSEYVFGLKYEEFKNLLIL